MNKVIENSLSMYKAVKAVCDANITLINANAGLTDTYKRYLDLLKEMDELGQDQTKDRTGITIDKRHAREALELSIERSSGIIKAQFDHDHNFDVFNTVNKTHSELHHMRDQLLIAHGQVVQDLITQHQALLAPFGVDAAYITASSATLTAYMDIVSKPTMARNSKTTSTVLLFEKSREIADFLKNELDGAMQILRADHLPVYLTYRNARKIVNNGIRHNLVGIISGVVKQEESGAPLAGALVEVTGTETDIVTNASGLFTIIDVPPATYSLRVSISGYDEKIVDNVVVTANEITNVEVKMVASV